MKTFVDQETCIGCALCAQIAPEIYEMFDGKAYIRVDDVPSDKFKETLESRDQCPVSAISISEN